jgi:hypothetical protein
MDKIVLSNAAKMGWYKIIEALAPWHKELAMIGTMSLSSQFVLLAS